MVRYFFFMTGNPVWFRIAKDLYEEEVAEPVLWFGDDRLNAMATEVFEDAVVKMLDMVHRPYSLPEVNYAGEYAEFFQSEDYIRAKDICFKMMDRFDMYGAFSRLDREAYFHKLTIWCLKTVHEKKPDALLMIERPHSHSQYLLYRVCKYLDVKIANFKACPLFPLNYLQYDEVHSVEKVMESDPEIWREFESTLAGYIDELSALSESGDSHSPSYMQRQRRDAKLDRKIKKFIFNDSKLIWKDFKHHVGNRLRGVYSPINPYRYGLIRRLWSKNTRRKNLRRFCQAATEQFDFSESFVYYPLHYEPERTTTPDGGDFYDHMVALVALRKLLPDHLKIVVKEHPSQFFLADKGSRGRSPLIYDVFKSVKGVVFVGTEGDSMDFIRRSSCVATLTGSVGIEAAIMGKKAITFGYTWYYDCPNTFAWREDLSFSEIENQPIADASTIHAFILEKLRKHGVPAMENMSASNMTHKEWVSDSFYEVQRKEAASLIKTFMVDIAR